MIRLRLRRGVTESELLRDGFKECRLVNGETRLNFSPSVLTMDLTRSRLS